VTETHSGAPTAASPRVIWTAIGLFAASLVLRCGYLWSVWDSPFVRYPMVDSLAYHEKALAILSGDWAGEGVFYQDPLYPYLLAGLYALFGSGSPAVLVAQACLDAISVVLVYALARRVCDERVALVAGLFACFYKVMFYYDALLLKVPLTLVLISLALYLLLRADERSTSRAWLATGFAFGLATLTRGNYLLFAPCALAWPYFVLPASGRRRNTAALLVGCGMAAAILPVTLRNYVVGDDFVLITAQAGQNFYIGNHRGNRTGEYRAPDFVEAHPFREQADFRAEGERRVGRALTPSELSRFWFGEALREIRADPKHFRRHLFRKARVFANDYEVPDNQSFAFFARHVSPLLGAPLPSFGFLLPLALCGAVYARSNRRALFLVLFTLVYSASVIAFFNMSRYRIPILPALFVLAAAGGVGLARRLLARELRTAIPALAFLAVAYPVVYQQLAAPDFSRVHTNMGAAHELRADAQQRRAHDREAAGEEAAARAAQQEAEALWDLSEVEYRKALEIQPKHRPTRVGLRKLLVKRVHVHLDADEFERARERALILTTRYPDFAEGHALHGEVLARLGEVPRAHEALARALALSPRNQRALRERARLLQSGAAAASDARNE
jgi:4-amino-4-deoxy-L-arabinose transferase-like glycosyltransferase